MCLLALNSFGRAIYRVLYSLIRSNVFWVFVKARTISGFAFILYRKKHRHTPTIVQSKDLEKVITVPKTNSVTVSLNFQIASAKNTVDFSEIERKENVKKS